MTTKNILYIRASANATMDKETICYLRQYAAHDAVVSVVSMPRGPRHLEYAYYRIAASQEIIKAVLKAEKDGYDAAIIGCFNDPCLVEAREICKKLIVTAPMESALHVAATLADRFSIIVGRDKWIPCMRDTVWQYGFRDKLASFRSLDLGVLDFHADKTLTMRRMREEIRRAVDEDGAEAIVLGCTMTFGFYAQLQEEFCLPVIDTMLCALKYTEMLVECKQKTGWYFSQKNRYATPPAAEYIEWNLAADYGLEGLLPEKA